MRRPGVGFARRGGFRGFGAAAPAWTPASLDNLLVWLEPRDASNTTSGGAFTQLTGLGSTASVTPFTTGPDDTTSDMLSGLRTALFDGSTDGMRNTSVGVPKTIVALYRQVTWVSGEAITSYGAGNRPQLRQSGVSNRVDFLAASTPISQPAVTFNDGYFRILIAEDDGSANQSLAAYDPACENPTSDSDANANARASGPATFSVGAFVAGTSPTNMEIAFVLATSDVLTTGEKASLVEYIRANFVDLQSLPAMTFVGTRTSRSDAQPRPYPTEHEGESGNTVAGCAARLVGTWGGSGGTTIGSADDPGAGNRGAMEDLSTDRSEANMVCVVHVGTNDASSGAINATNYERFIRRLWAVAGVGPGSITKILLCSITGRTDGAGVPQGRIDTFNGTDLPTIITNLTGDSIPAVLCDLATSFNTGTMLGSDGLHPNKTGAMYIAQTVYDTLTAQSLVSASNRLVLIGDSITEGGTSFIQATAQYRPWLAKLIAEA